MDSTHALRSRRAEPGRPARRLAALVLALAFWAGLSGTASPAGAQTAIDACPAPVTWPSPTNPAYRRGPDPTAASVSAERGPFSYTTTRVTGQSGFAGGTIYRPSNAGTGTLGGIVLTPPFLFQSWIANTPMATRLASNGFVVLAFDANTVFDFPSSRARQAKAALQYLVEQSPARSTVDPNRLAIGGYSMGGGAALEVARDVPTFRAAMPYAPWNFVTDFSGVRVPTLVMTAANDTTAAPSGHGIPFFNSLPDAIPKGYAEWESGGHPFPNFPSPSMTGYAVAFMKRWVDGDTRYSQFLGTAADDLSTFRSCSLR